jgi:hypothetical protein
MLGAAALVAVLAGSCGGDDKGKSGDMTGDGSPGGAQGGAAGGGGALTIAFNPMYSAYDDGAHEFQVPVKVDGATGKLTVTTAPTDFVDQRPATAGVTLITKKAGKATVTITDEAGNKGTAELTVTKNDPGDVDIGRERYANGIEALNLPEGGIAALQSDGGIPMIPRNEMGACTFCHKPDGSQPVTMTTDITQVDVEHTPQQTAGFSDEELIKIFSEGIKPAGASYRVVNGGGMLPDEVAAVIYGRFHKWSVDPKVRVGIVAYLRSLTPKAQGFIDFGGLRPPGIMMGPKPEPDPSCPTVSAIGQMLVGCCKEGMCGIDVSTFGMGCVELGKAAMDAMRMGFPIQFPAPQACGGS